MDIQTRIAEVAAQKNAPVQDVVDALVAAIKDSIKKTYGKGLDIEVGLLSDGGIEAYIFKEVVEDGAVTDADTQIALKDALKHDEEASIDEELGIPVNVVSLEAKVREPGQLERLYERYRKKSEPQQSEPQNSRTSNIEPRKDGNPLLTGRMPVPPGRGGFETRPVSPRPNPTEWVQDSNGKLVEVPYEDKRTPRQRVAELHKETDEWADNLIAQFTEKVRNYAGFIKGIISDKVK